MSVAQARKAMQAGLKAKASPNAVDRLVKVFSPSKYEKRMNTRGRSAFSEAMASSGGYSGASKSRRSLSGFNPGVGDADTDILNDLPTLRNRSRDLVRNSALAAGALNTTVANVVGTGLRVQSQIDTDYLGISQEDADKWQRSAEREFNRHAKSTFIDSTNSRTFADLQTVVFRSAWESGDVFSILTNIDRVKKGATYGVAVQVIEGDRVSNPNWAQDTTKIAGGVEKNSSTGEPEKVHVFRGHPGARYRTKDHKWDSVDVWGKKTGRRNVLHIYRHLRPGQTRGVPAVAPVIEALKQLGDYTDAELMAAVISGMFTVFMKSESPEYGGLETMIPTSEVGGSSTDEDYKLAPGAILEMGTEDSIETANPGRPNAGFDPFVLAILRQVGVALELPFEVLVGHFTASYSAARAAMLQAWKFFKIRRKWMANYFCQPVYEAVIDEAVAMGRIAAPGYFTDPTVRDAYLGAAWIGDAPGQIDSFKEMRANEIAEDRGWKTGAEITTEITGGDWEQNHERRVREFNLRKEAGINVESVAQRSITETFPSDED